MRGLRITDACKGVQVHAVCPVETATENRMKVDHIKSTRKPKAEFPPHTSSSLAKVTEPCLKPCLKFVDHVEALAEIHAEIEVASDEEKSRLYLEQSFVFRGLDETKLTRRSLRLARQHATSAHEKLVYAAWLKYEKREEEVGNRTVGSCNDNALECPRAALYQVFERHAASESCAYANYYRSSEPEGLQCSTSDGKEDNVIFRIDNDKVPCHRRSLASLSRPFQAMLYGCFAESKTMEIDFSHNGISIAGMNAVAEFSRTGRLGQLPADILFELLTFSNRFCCEKMKSACDKRLANLVANLQDAVAFIDNSIEENAFALVSSCLQNMLGELPVSLRNTQVSRLFCSMEGRRKLTMVDHSSFALYSLLSQAAMEEDLTSDLSLLLLERAWETAVSHRQKALALHQLGCVMLGRKQYREAQSHFEEAAKEGHVYSLTGVARAKYKRGHCVSAYKDSTILLSTHKPTGWMHQERSLYCEGEEKLMDLDFATEHDPTLTFPYKYRAAALMDAEKCHAAFTEINRILGFKVTPDCLELRAYFCLDLQDYEAALRDIRAILTLDPNYMMYSGRVAAEQLLRLLNENVGPRTKADCWMQLYDRWSSVDDIGSLAVVHQMLESEPGKGLLCFRQSLLLLRLNCPRAAMHSLRLASKYASNDHERLVYEGWISYDTGHRDEALKKAEESILIQRSFEAFFLKAYALADTSLDPDSSAKVIYLLEEALKCPSDGLRKGQALNNLGSVYVDSRKLDLAADCYVSALKIHHTRAHQGLARVHHLKNDRKAAYEEMTKLVEKARNNASAYEKRSEYCDRDMAKADLSLATQLDPLRTYPYRYRAAVLMDDHKEDEAIAELSKAISFKSDVQLLHLRAAFYESMGDIVGSLRDCRAALSVDSNHLETLDLYNRVHGRVNS